MSSFWNLGVVAQMYCMVADFFIVVVVKTKEFPELKYERQPLFCQNPILLSKCNDISLVEQ